MKSWLGTQWVRAVALVSAAMVAVVVSALGWQLSTRAHPSGAMSRSSSGTAAATVSSVASTPTSTATSTATSTTTAAAATPDPAWATILIQSKLVHFETGILGSPSDVLIDPSNSVRVAVDGSGQVAAFFKTFTYTPVFDNKPYPDSYGSEDGYWHAQLVGSSYSVPQNCLQQLYGDAGNVNATNALWDIIKNYENATGGDVQEVVQRWSPTYPINYDTSHVACNPAPGYTQSQPFAYAALEPASVQLPLFRFSDVMAYRINQAKAHAPADYVYESIRPCDTGQVGGVNPTFVDVGCSVYGNYRWNWTSAGAHMLASQIAGKDPATATSILAQYPGASIFYDSQGISFQITGSSQLPVDPSHITFKIYDTVLVGTTGVQTTGTPLLLP